MPTPSSRSAIGAQILITGGTGFVGRALVQRLIADANAVTVLHRGSSAVPAGCESIATERWLPTEIAAVLEGRRFDGVFNLAAYGVNPAERDPEVMFRVNLACAQQVLRHAIATRAGFFVHAGSSAEYASLEQARPVLETDPLEFGKLYGASKAAATIALLAEAAQAALPCAVARLFGVYGPREAPHRLLTMLWKNLSKGQRVPLSHGRQVRDWCHVDDVAYGLVAVAQATAAGKSQLLANLCSGKGVSVREFARKVAAAAGASEELLGFGDLPLRADDVMYLVGSTARMQKLTNWQPQMPLEVGIGNAIAALEQQTE